MEKSSLVEVDVLWKELDLPQTLKYHALIDYPCDYASHEEIGKRLSK
jgi:hypothetical protein